MSKIDITYNQEYEDMLEFIHQYDENVVAIVAAKYHKPKDLREVTDAREYYLEHWIIDVEYSTDTGTFLRKVRIDGAEFRKFCSKKHAVTFL